MKTQKNGRIESVQTLRALAFLCIFMTHTGAVSSAFGGLGVSVFVVLSGCLLTMRHIDSKLPCGIKDSFRFAVGRIKRLYLLHIICMLLYYPISAKSVFAYGVSGTSLRIMARKVLMNVFLVQSWYPSVYESMSLNGVAWYLSTTLFLYLFFPLLLRWVKWFRSMRMTLPASLMTFSVMLAARAATMELSGSDGTLGEWFAYICPLYRMGDFFIGCCLGSFVYDRQNKARKPAWMTSAELLGFAFAAGSIILQNADGTFLLKMLNSSTLASLPASLLLCASFVLGGGLFSKTLTNRAMIYLGDISPYAFLIHCVCNKWCRVAFAAYCPDIHILWQVIIEFIVSLSLSAAYMSLVKKRLSER